MVAKKRPPASAGESFPRRMARLFRGLSRAHGVYDQMGRPLGGKKVEGKALTVRKEVTEEIWAAHLDGTRGIGIVPVTDEGICYFGAIDIDKYDMTFEDVERKVKKFKLPLVLTRSKSGGLHLYCFSASGVPAALMRARLEEWAVALGHGGAEIFPKQSKLMNLNDTGNWINMPYLGSDKTDRYGIWDSKRMSLADYLDLGEVVAKNLTEKVLMEKVLPLGEEFLEGPPCLQSIMQRGGFTEGMRNSGMFAVGVYLKKRYPDSWKTVIYSYNTKCFMPPVEEKELKTVIKSLSREKDYNYPCSKHPIVKLCNKPLCKQREFGVGKGLDEWNVIIGTDVQKVMTEPPLWIISVNGERVQLYTEELMQQRLFHRLVFDRLGIKPTTLPTPKWDAQLNLIGQNAQVVDAPEDAGPTGELAFHLQQFCTEFPQAETRQEILTGKPFTEDGWIYFRGADFRKYLDTQHFRALQGGRVYGTLHGFGVTKGSLWLGDKNRMALKVWKIEQSKFAGSSEPIPERTVDKGGM